MVTPDTTPDGLWRFLFKAQTSLRPSKPSTRHVSRSPNCRVDIKVDEDVLCDRGLRAQNENQQSTYWTALSVFYDTVKLSELPLPEPDISLLKMYRSNSLGVRLSQRRLKGPQRRRPNGLAAFYGIYSMWKCVVRRKVMLGGGKGFEPLFCKAYLFLCIKSILALYVSNSNFQSSTRSS